MLNVFIVFLVSGLWHGANWTFVIWGAIHGIYQIIGSFTRPVRDSFWSVVFKRGAKAPIIMWSRRLLTFLLVSFAWIFFRANTPEDAFILIERMVVGWDSGLWESLSDMGLSAIGIAMTALSVGTLILIDNMLRYDDAQDGSRVLVQRGAYIIFAWAILLSWMLLLSKDMISTFIYFQF